MESESVIYGKIFISNYSIIGSCGNRVSFNRKRSKTINKYARNLLKTSRAKDLEDVYRYYDGETAALTFYSINHNADMDRHHFYFMHMQCKDIMNTYHEMMRHELVQYDVDTRLELIDSYTGAPLSLEQKAQMALLTDMLLMVRRTGYSLFSDSAQTLSALLVAAFVVKEDAVVEYEQLSQFYTYAFHSLRNLFDIPTQLADKLSYEDGEYLMSSIAEDYTPALAKKYVALIDALKELGCTKVEVNGEVTIHGDIIHEGGMKIVRPQ